MLPVRFARVAAGLAAGALLSSPALALQPRQDAGTLEGRTWQETEAQPSLVMYEAGRADVPSEMARFLAEQGGRWEVRWDARNERPHLVQGSGVPLMPGRGNRLTRAQAGLGPGEEVRVEDMERLVRAFMARYPEMFRIAPQSLRLDRERSASSGPLWFVELQQFQQGVPVAGAKVFFRINNGNMVQFGADRIAEVGIGVQPAVDRAEARERGLDALGVSVLDIAETPDTGRLEIDPVLTEGERAGEPYAGLAGFGYDHQLVWRSRVRLRGDGARYQLTVDARSGALLRAEGLDRSAAANVTGGIYPVTNSDTESLKRLPFIAVTNGGAKFTNAAGQYDYTGGVASSSLDGKYVHVVDSCGAASLSNSTNGTLAFGTGGGTDCGTPGAGGAGNTHAARNAVYHLTQINRKAATYLPSNAWLASKVTVNTNRTGTCNAVWNGSSLSFYRSGGGCTNSGEISSILFHEWGHGLDDNAGGTSNDPATGEALGDTFAILQTHDACIGRNLKPGVACPNCPASCTGVRDVSAFATGGPSVAKASTAKADAGMNCDVYACNAAFHGPLGYEAHCESAIAGSANWDLSRSLVDAYGTDTGWSRLESIWYSSLVTGKSAYRVASGGNSCNTAAVTDGCLTDNWYSVYLAANDDDGNLANGTPDACRIWSALNAHGLACGTQPACTSSGATPTPTPTHTPTPAPTPTPTNTPTATPTSPAGTPVPTATPVVPTPTPAPTNFIQDGGFEQGLFYWGLINVQSETGWGWDFTHTHSGNVALLLQGNTFAGYPTFTPIGVSQSVDIPSYAQGNLSFWLNVTTSDGGNIPFPDQLTVEIWSPSGTSPLATLATFTPLDAAPLGVYTLHSYDVSAFKGQTIVLKFVSVENGVLPTLFRIDDVSLY